MNHLSSIFFGLSNHPEFLKGVQHAVNQMKVKDGIYTGDNLVTYNRNLSFLGDDKLMASHRVRAETDVEKAILWRVAVVAWGAFNGMRLAGGGTLSNADATRD